MLDLSLHRELKKSQIVSRIAICRGKCENSRFVTENGENRDSARAVISFCPCPKTFTICFRDHSKEIVGPEF